MEIKAKHIIDDGYVQLVEKWGSDQKIVDCASVSYGERQKTPTDLFIDNLYRLGHMTPFEQAGVTVKIECPIFVWRQWIRHRLASVNEISERYTESKCKFFSPVVWRTKGGVELSDEDILELDRETSLLHQHMERVYRRRLELGVTRELARIDLPLSKYTTAYWTANLREVFHLLKLRLDKSAQFETREYAFGLAMVVRNVFPCSFKAFVKYEGLEEQVPNLIQGVK